MSNQPEDEQPEKKRQQNRKGRGHGEGSVFMRKTGDRNKPWVAQIPLGRGQKRIVGYYATKQEAIAAKNKALQEIELVKRVRNSKQTVGEYLEYWLEHVQRLSVRLSSYVPNSYHDSLSYSACSGEYSYPEINSKRCAAICE